MFIADLEAVKTRHSDNIAIQIAMHAFTDGFADPIKSCRAKTDMMTSLRAINKAACGAKLLQTSYHLRLVVWSRKTVAISVTKRTAAKLCVVATWALTPTHLLIYIITDIPGCFQQKPAYLTNS